MARKNKKAELSYLQLPLPNGRKSYRTVKRSWSGLNYKQTIDSGALSMEKNISTFESPYLTPSEKREAYLEEYSHPISLFGFEDFLILIYRKNSSVYVDYISADENIYTGLLKTDATKNDEYSRSVVQFNVYDTPTDPVTGEYIKKLLIFPDKKSMDFDFRSVSEFPEEPNMGIVYCVETNGQKKYRRYSSVEEYEEYEGYFPVSDMDVLVKEYTNNTPETDESGATIYPPPDTASHQFYYKNKYNQEVYRWCEYETSDGGSAQGWKVSIPPAMPNIKYATVHMSRVFGVDDDRVYASGFNDYTNWNLDTVDECNESNAWCSPAQSNTKAGGAFTGITTFQNHVVCFKRDFMHEIYNTKNPFRIQDIYREGAIDNRTIQDVDGRLIFVSEDNVKIYTGSNPRIISYYLDIGRYTKAVSGTDGRNYYLYCEDADERRRMFVYDTLAESWSEQTISYEVLNFAKNKNGFFALCENGTVYKLDSGNYEQDWSFETDLFTNQTVDIKHLKKIQCFVYLGEGSNIKIYALYDDEKFSPNSHLVFESNKEGQIAIRVKTRQTASYGIKLHIEGYGYAKIYEMEMIMEAGGGLYV